MIIPERLAAACRGSADRRAWLARLPQTIEELRERWSLSLGVPFDHDDVSCAWVAPVTRRDGARAVLKIGMPHMEAAHEREGLRFWNGDPTVRLLDEDVIPVASGFSRTGMLLERCEPGTSLRRVPETEQDTIIAGLFRRLWRVPSPPHSFRPLASMLKDWSEETIAAEHQGPDPGLVREGLRLFEELSRPSGDDVLLATDLHAGNVLRAEREPWLVIDPKPFVGDRAYDATQHLLNCPARLDGAPRDTIRRFADLIEVDAEHVRLWLLARVAAEPRDNWRDESTALAKRLASCGHGIGVRIIE
jgi:streptomycin 6-kinase